MALEKVGNKYNEKLISGLTSSGMDGIRYVRMVAKDSAVPIINTLKREPSSVVKKIRGIRASRKETTLKNKLLAKRKFLNEVR